ncbi:MAG: catalase, partial [Pseudomonadota bacterium]
VKPTQDFFLDNLQANLKEDNVVWNMVITISNPDDPIDNAAIPWTGEHTKIVAATLEIHSAATEEAGQCNNINYDPLVLTSGFAPSNDPLLAARRSSYAITFSKRLAEQQKMKEQKYD